MNRILKIIGSPQIQICFDIFFVIYCAYVSFGYLHNNKIKFIIFLILTILNCYCAYLHIRTILKKMKEENNDLGR